MSNGNGDHPDVTAADAEPDAAIEPDEVIEAEVADAAEAEVEVEPAEAEVEAGADSTAADGADAAEAGVAAQLAERTEDLQRLQAEFTNYRRRVERDRQATIDAAKAGVLKDVLPILDDLDRADAHGDLAEGSPLALFGDKLRQFATGHKVEAFGVAGEPFNPELHEAVQDESDGSDQVLGTVLRKGYRVGDRTLRTAMVIVGSSVAE